MRLYARRGDIYDRDGTKLVFNLPVKSYFVVPGEVTDPKRLGVLFSQLLDIPSSQITANLKRNDHFAWVVRKMGPVECAIIESWNIAGLYDQEEIERYYPNRALACQVLGFTNIDNKGLEGVELQFDEILAGQNGRVVVQMDARGRTIPMLEYPREEPVDGNSIALTIHSSYQAIAERELAQGIHDTDAQAGCVILMAPGTGEILAMATEPRYDLNDPGGVPADRRRNRAITDLFEPGSTFKIVAAAAAIEEGIKQPDDLIDCEGGRMRVCTKWIQDVEENDWLTFKQVIEKSSNIGTIKIARELGKKTFYCYVRDFGFGSRTGIDLPGEVNGLLAHYRTWSDMSLPSMSIGHEVAVTPLQLICAYASVANGGKLMQPMIARHVLDQRGNIVKTFTPTRIREVISEQAAATLRSFLTQAVESGTGKMARIDGYQVAGKTGTACKLKEDGSGFSRSRFVASFCGFFPAEDPQLVGLIVLDEPKSPHSGGKAAAPVFRRIVEHILHLPKGPCADLCLSGGYSDGRGKRVAVPDISGLDRDQALTCLRKKGLLGQPQGTGGVVCHQQPGAGVLMARGERVLVSLCPAGDNRSSGTQIPSVVGMTLREAVRQLHRQGVQVKVSGSGVVTRQQPRAGSRVDPELICQLECTPSGEGGDVLTVASGRTGDISLP
jgi:cell division protein FtsI/penicillin-binding protein 2